MIERCFGMIFLQHTKLAIHPSLNYFNISLPDLSAYSEICGNSRLTFLILQKILSASGWVTGLGAESPRLFDDSSHLALQNSSLYAKRNKI